MRQDMKYCPVQLLPAGGFKTVLRARVLTALRAKAAGLLNGSGKIVAYFSCI